MEEMRRLYEKVEKSSMLQKKLIWIANEAASAGRKKTRERLIDFAKDIGFDISIEEMRRFFMDMSDRQHMELNDEQLETVAGGTDVQNIFIKLFFDYI